MKYLNKFLKKQNILPQRLTLEKPDELVVAGVNAEIDSVTFVNFLLELEMYLSNEIDCDLDLFYIIENKNFISLKIFELDTLIIDEIDKLE